MLRCIRCAKAGEAKGDIQGTCVDAQTIGCPEPVGVIPGKDIVLLCREPLCGKQFSFPAYRIPGRGIPTEVSCMRSPCSILVVNPSLSLNPPKNKNTSRGKTQEG